MKRLVPALLLCAAGILSAQQLPAYRNRMLGVYDESGDPIEGVEILDLQTGIKAVTTKTGTVTLSYLPEGGSLIRTRKLGWESHTRFVAISEADTVPVMIVLARAQSLPVVLVKDTAPKHIGPGLNAFEERRSKGFGHFIPPDEMRKADNVSMGTFIASRIPGLKMQPGVGAANYLVSSRKNCAGPVLRKCTVPDCFVTVIVDGVRIFDVARMLGEQNGGFGGLDKRAMSQIPDFAHMNVRDYAAVEFYAGGASLPAQYNITSSDCGTLMLWSREK
jgi:hypothetical protein